MHAFHLPCETQMACFGFLERNQTIKTCAWASASGASCPTARVKDSLVPFPRTCVRRLFLCDILKPCSPTDPAPIPTLNCEPGEMAIVEAKLLCTHQHTREGLCSHALGCAFALVASSTRYTRPLKLMPLWLLRLISQVRDVE